MNADLPCARGHLLLPLQRMLSNAPSVTLRQQIFVYRDLWTWLNQPETPPHQFDDAQLGFAWPC